MKLSIIIPVYNVKQYLVRCLDSCLEQDLPVDDYEIIAINDGSTDGCLAILDSYVRDYPNIFVFSQINKGLSAARNKGISFAKGEYIWFVDSDDSIKPNCLDALLNYSISNQLDVLAFDNNESNLRQIKSNYQNIVCTGEDFLSRLNNVVSVWSYLWKRSFLAENKLLFCDSLLHEDMEFTPRALFLAQKTMYVKTSPYIVFERIGSISRTINPKRSLDLITIAKSLYLFKENFVETDRTQVVFNRIIGTCILSAVRICNSLEKKDVDKVMVALRSNAWLKKVLNKRRTPSFNIEGVLFKIDPLVYYYADRIVCYIKTKTNKRCH